MTQRDIAIVRSVYQYRVLTIHQIELLLFHSPQTSEQRRTRCAERLKRLYHHGLLQRREQPVTLDQGRKPFLYLLDRAGRDFLAQLENREPKEIDWKPSDNRTGTGFLNHLLATNDVRISISLACQIAGYKLSRWIDDKSLRSATMRDTVLLPARSGPGGEVAIVPDGYFQIEIEDDRSHAAYHSLLEIDMGTMTPTRFGRKIPAYLMYEQSGKYAERYETQSPMRVLTVTTDIPRLERLLQVTEGNSGGGNFWFTTFEQLHQNSFLTQPIWQLAGHEGQLQGFLD